MTNIHRQDLQNEDAHARLRAELAKFAVVERPSPEHIKRVSEAVERAGMSVATGKVAYYGANGSNGYSVQFNKDDGSGFVSSWPAWAYEIARDAKLHDKKLWVMSNGDPFGSNLLSVSVL